MVRAGEMRWDRATKLSVAVVLGSARRVTRPDYVAGSSSSRCCYTVVSGGRAHVQGRWRQDCVLVSKPFGAYSIGSAVHAGLILVVHREGNLARVAYPPR